MKFGYGIFKIALDLLMGPTLKKSAAISHSSPSIESPSAFSNRIHSGRFHTMQKCALTFLCLLIAPLSSWSQEAFVFRSNQLVVDAAAHWSQWSYQNDRVDALATSMPSSQLFDIDAKDLQK